MFKWLWRVGAICLMGVAVAAVAAHEDVSEYDDYTYTNAETGTMVRIYVEGDTRFFESNVLPDHDVGEFPNSGNPHTLSEQNLFLQAPANPELANQTTEVGLGKFGLAINGVPFEREAAEWYNRDRNSGWQYDAFGGGLDLGFDFNNAHVQPTGLYHYHGVPEVLVDEDAASGNEHPHLVGFAGDGFPIYLIFGYADPMDASSDVVALQPSYQLKQGTRPSGPGGAYDGTFNEDFEFVEASGDLDACNGRVGITPEFPEGTYYYVLTSAFPRVPTCWSGNVGEGWIPGSGQGAAADGNNANGGQQQQGQQQGGGSDLAAAARQLGVTEQALSAALGNQRPPDFAAAAAQLGVSESALRQALGAPPN